MCSWSTIIRPITPPPSSRVWPRTHPRIALIRSPPLPPRWIGKSHACCHRRARGGAGKRMAVLHRCRRDARRLPRCRAPGRPPCGGNLDLLSLMPRQELKSVAERLILPCGLILLSFLQDLRQSQARSGREVSATGQFMLVRRDAYEAVGGHAAVCTAICEDLEFARRLKQSGHAVLLMGGDKHAGDADVYRLGDAVAGARQEPGRYIRRSGRDLGRGAGGGDRRLGGLLAPAV